MSMNQKHAILFVAVLMLALGGKLFGS